MADWTTIPDSSLEVGQPIRSIDTLALRDNPIAIAQGAVGAPRIAAAALQTGTNERDWVLSRTADAAVGAVGTYAFLGEVNSVTTTPGSTRAGSSLRYAGIMATQDFAQNQPTMPSFHGGINTTPAGTWRCMGVARSNGLGSFGASLWLRIS